MKHELKIWPQYFARVSDGSKTFEVRENDRGFQQGDEVVLREWDPEEDPHDTDPMGRSMGTAMGYTHEQLAFRIGFVLPIDATRVVFSLLPYQPKESQS